MFPHQDPAVACAVARSSYNKPGVSASACACRAHQQSKEILLTNKIQQNLCVPAFSVLPHVALVTSFLVFPPFPLLLFHFPFFSLCLALPTLSNICVSSSLIPCLFLGHRCPLHMLPCQCHWRRTLPRLGAITGFQLLSCFCCVHLDVSNDTAIVELSNLLVPEEFPESLQFSSVQVSRSQTQQFWVSVIFLLREQPRGQCLSSELYICVLELPRCHSFSWSTTWSTKPPEVSNASHVWNVQAVLRCLLSCHVLSVPSRAASG